MGNPTPPCPQVPTHCSHSLDMQWLSRRDNGVWHGDTRLQDRHISESEHKHICLEHIGAWSGETLQEGRAQGSAVVVMRHPGQGTGQEPHLHLDPARSLGQVGSDEPVPCSGGGDVHKGGVLHCTAQGDADVVGGTDGGVGRKASAQRVDDGRGSMAKVPVRDTTVRANSGKHRHRQDKLGYKLAWDWKGSRLENPTFSSGVIIFIW